MARLHPCGSDYAVVAFNRGQCGVLHQPEDGIDRLVEFIHAVGAPEAVLNGAAVAVSDILGNYDLLAVLVKCHAVVLNCDGTCYRMISKS